MQFTYSNIFYYEYSPISEPSKLPLFDRFPLVIFLEIHGQTATGINLHWIPVPLRVKFVALIMEMQAKSFNKNMFRLWYNMIKYNPALSFTLIAIRKYYISHCYNVQVIPSSEWGELPTAWAVRYKARYMRRAISNPLIYK